MNVKVRDSEAKMQKQLLAKSQPVFFIEIKMHSFKLKFNMEFKHVIYVSWEKNLNIFWIRFRIDVVVNRSNFKIK